MVAVCAEAPHRRHPEIGVLDTRKGNARAVRSDAQLEGLRYGISRMVVVELL